MTTATTRSLSPTWAIALGGWERAMRRADLSERTITNRRRTIVRYAQAFPSPWVVPADDIASWLNAPERWPAITSKLMGTTLRTFYTWAVTVGHLTASPVPVAGRLRAPINPAWSDALDAWARSERDTGRSAATVAKYIQRIELYASTDSPASPWDVTGTHLLTWFRAQPWEPITEKATRSALRGFYAWAHAAGRITTNPTDYLSAIDAPANTRPLGTRGPEPLAIPDAWAGPVTLFTRNLLARGQSRESLRLRRAHLSRIARDLRPLTPWEVTADDLLDWMAARDCARSTLRSMRQTLVGFYGWAVTEGHIDTDPTARLPRVPNSEPNPRPAPEQVISRAMQAADSRTRLMIRLGAELGLRCGEISRVHTNDLLERDGGWSLIVRGKGKRDRLLPMPSTLGALIHGLPPGWAFPSTGAPAGHLTADYVSELINRLLPPGVTPHALRHRFATRAYELDRDIFTVQRLLGHASPDTTQRYVATTEATLRSTVDRLAGWTEQQAHTIPVS